MNKSLSKFSDSLMIEYFVSAIWEVISVVIQKHNSQQSEYEQSLNDQNNH